MGHQSAVNHGNHRAEMADHWQVTFAQFPAMNLSVAAAHGTDRRTKTSANGFEGSFAESQASGAVANQRRKLITFAEGYAGRDADGLLAASQIDAAARDLAGAIKTSQFVIHGAR